MRGWLSLAYALARPLAGLPPLVVTALGLVVAGAAVVPSAAGGPWLWRRGFSSGSPGLLDSLDGALAIGTGRASPRGFVLDSVVDRLTEAAFAAALWVAGAPGWLAVAFGALCWLPDYLRARAGRQGWPRRVRCRCGSARPASSSPASRWSVRVSWLGSMSNALWSRRARP